jgi:hypothetical protein
MHLLRDQHNEAHARPGDPQPHVVVALVLKVPGRGTNMGIE